MSRASPYSRQTAQQFSLHSQPVYRNFHETVPVGQHSFSVTVPRSFASVKLPNGETVYRKFRFTELNITPGFFSQRALVLGVDGDGTVEPAETDLNLAFRLGYICNESLYFEENMDGTLKEKPFLTARRELTLQNFVNAVNTHFQSLVPAGFARSPVFVDWVDLTWYHNEDGPEDVHNSADQKTPLSVNPEDWVGLFSLVYYGTEREEVGNYSNALPHSVRKLTGVNNFLFPTLPTIEEMENIRLRIHVAPNVMLSLSSEAQLRALGFSDQQLGGRGRKKRYQFDNAGFGDNYIIFTGETFPELNLPASTGTWHVHPSETLWRFEEKEMKFPAGAFSENTRVHAVVQGALDVALETAGLSMPKLRYDGASGKFRFEHPPNDRLALFVEGDDRIAERLGFGPVRRITKSLLSSEVRDGSSRVDAETLSKALAYDAGMCIVTLDEASSMDTYGIDDLTMTTLWPTPTGTFRMSDTFSRDTFLPTSGGSTQNHLIQLLFTVSTLKKDSTRVPLTWPIPFCAEGTLEGNA